MSIYSLNSDRLSIPCTLPFSYDIICLHSPCHLQLVTPMVVYETNVTMKESTKVPSFSTNNCEQLAHACSK